MNLLGITGWYPRVHLLIVEIAICDAFLESFDKRSHEERIVKELLKTLFSLVTAGTIPVAKYYKVLALIAFQLLMTLKLFLNLRANLIT